MPKGGRVFFRDRYFMIKILPSISLFFSICLLVGYYMIFCIIWKDPSAYIW